MLLFCMRKQIEIRPGIHGIKIDTTHTSQERIREQIQNHKKCHAGKHIFSAWHFVSIKCRFLRKIRPFICRNFRQNNIESAIIIADFQKK